MSSNVQILMSLAVMNLLNNTCQLWKPIWFAASNVVGSSVNDFDPLRLLVMLWVFVILQHKKGYYIQHSL
jgi:hypothetical protein